MVPQDKLTPGPDMSHHMHELTEAELNDAAHRARQEKQRRSPSGGVVNSNIVSQS